MSLIDVELTAVLDYASSYLIESSILQSPSGNLVQSKVSVIQPFREITVSQLKLTTTHPDLLIWKELLL